MNKTPCLYALVRFTPFVETGEFANVGVVLMAPDSRFFGFKLMDRRHGRITEFFAPLRAQVFRNLMKTLTQELNEKHQLLKQHGFDRRLKNSDVEFAKRVFFEITRTRETIMQFGEVRGALVANPEHKLQELYDYYVERNFVTRQYQEQALETSVRKILIEANAIDRFISTNVGNDDYHIRFPFVETDADGPQRIIKPLHLAHDQASKIIDHGIHWVGRIQALKKRNLLPGRVLVAVGGPHQDNLPPAATDARQHAFADIVTDLKDCGVTVCDHADAEQIASFASA